LDFADHPAAACNSIIWCLQLYLFLGHQDPAPRDTDLDYSGPPQNWDLDGVGQGRVSSAPYDKIGEEGIDTAQNPWIRKGTSRAIGRTGVLELPHVMSGRSAAFPGARIDLSSFAKAW